MDDYSQNERISEANARIRELERLVRRLQDDLRQTQLVLNQALDALEQLGHPINARVGREPPPALKDWKMKPIDE